MSRIAGYEQEAHDAAEGFRKDQGLGVAPLGDLVTLIEQTRGVDVTVLHINDENEHGLTVVDPKRAATIVAVACTDHPMRWRSNLGHELGHLVFNDHVAGQPGTVNHDAPVERRAQSFARHLLIPRGGIQHLLNIHETQPQDRESGVVDVRLLSDLVQRFQVSPAMAALQLRGMTAIDQHAWEEWSSLSTRSLAARFGWADQYAAWQSESRQHRAPQRLLARAVAGYLAGVVSLATVASVRGVAPEVLAAEFADAGIEPTSTPAEPDPGDQLAIAPAASVDLTWLDDE